MNDPLFKTRVAVLWVAVAVALSGSLLLGLFTPGTLEELLAGEIEGETLDDATGSFLATLVIIPLALAGVTLLVSDRVNRYLNPIAGLAFGLFGAWAAVSEILGGHLDGHVVMVVTAVALALLIGGLGCVRLRQPSSL